MSEDNFQYRPLDGNSSKRSKPNPLKKLPKFKLPNFKKNGKTDWKQILIWIGIGFVGLIIVGIVSLTLLIAIVSIGLPDIHDLDKLYVAQSTTIHDREGNVLYVKHGGENREYIPYEQISTNIINATVAIEDDQYWSHSGFDPVGITRALVNNITGGSKQGGSTITQQYIKNAFLSSERTYDRKIKELILAVRLEQEFDKKKILELYLNKIPYGNNAFGVEKAAQIYFGKNAKDLDIAESSILASLPKAPSYYNPYGPHRNTELAKTFEPDEVSARNIKNESDLKENEFLRGLIGKNVELDSSHKVYLQGRTDLVLKAMRNSGFISDTEMTEALDKLQTIEFNEYHENIRAPHYVFYVINQLEDKYGKEIVEQGGLQVYTTLDPKLQEYAEESIQTGVEKNTASYNAKNGALVSIDPTTGEILAMVGSKDYFSEEIDGAVNIATQYRQPGSSFKPIVFAQAFYNRYAPASIIFDVKTRFGASAFPNNYDGSFMGPMSIRKALAQSRNIPAIKAYFLSEGQEEIINLSQKMGIQFLDTERDYGWPLALGTAEVRPLDITSAFGVFANNGVRHEPISIIKVENSQGEKLEEWKPTQGEEVLDPQIAYLIAHILSDKSVGLGENLVVPGQVTAAKTGTSNIREGNTTLPRDLWTIGFSPNLVTAVWTGNNKAGDGKIGATASGLTTSAPIWKSYMTKALQGSQSTDFTVPEGITTASVSKLTGKLPGPGTPEDQIVEEIFASFSVPTEIDEGFTSVEIDTRNNMLANAYCPPKFTKKVDFLTLQAIAPYEEWQIGVDAWLNSNMEKLREGAEVEATGSVIFGQPPSSESELCTEEAEKDKPTVKIKSPKNNSEAKSGTTIKVKVDIKAKNGTESVAYYLDETLKYTSNDAPFTGTIRLPTGEIGHNKHSIKAVVTDNMGYAVEKEINIITSANPDNNNDDPPEEEEEEPSEIPEAEEEIIEPEIVPEEEEPLDDLPPPEEETDSDPPPPDSPTI